MVQEHQSSRIKRRLLSSVLTALVVVVSILTIVAYQRALQNPPNIVWSLFSGYYRYDPRVQSPPNGLFGDRIESSLHYFFDATLKRCGGTYPPLSKAKVEHYEVEEVEYFGYTDYHAFSHLHTRVFFADGQSIRVVFRFEAGHNEGDPLLFFAGSTVRAGAWMSLGLLRDPNVPPPGWQTYDQDVQPFACNPGPPYTIEEIQ